MDSVLLKTFLIALFFCFAVSNSSKLSSSSGTFLRSTTVRQSKQCPVNICFVFDGSGSRSSSDFTDQHIFAGDLISLISAIGPIRWAATQYGSKNFPISAFTTSTYQFTNELYETERAGGLSAVSDGIAYCEQQFRDFKHDINVMFLFTDGRYNLGVDPFKYIDLVKKEFKHLKVLPVTFGFASFSSFSGFPSVYEVDDFNSVLDADLEIESYQYDICKS